MKGGTKGAAFAIERFTRELILASTTAHSAHRIVYWLGCIACYACRILALPIVRTSRQRERIMRSRANVRHGGLSPFLSLSALLSALSRTLRRARPVFLASRRIESFL